MTVQNLPAVNALLNASSAVLLAMGYLAIRRHRRRLHKICMLSAFVLSSIFMVSYLTYHARVGTVYFKGQGPVRWIYLGILGTHTVLAAVNVPLILRTLQLTLQGRFEEHRKIAGWTWPSWMYVSVTGVFVYWMLYRF